MTKGDDFERLPKTVVPSHYQISIEPDLEKFTFTGEETVTLSIKEDTDKIVLNSLDIEISHASYKPSNEGEFVEARNIELNGKTERAVITFSPSLKAGTTGELKLSFSGILNDKMKGFYRSRYPQGEGKSDKWAAVTQFEPTEARRAFPCWDEPAIKATFEIKLIAPKDQVCLSNMPVVKETVRGNGKKEVQFDITPIMSTYLVAYVVGEYEFLESKTTDGKVNVRVYTPPGKKEQGQFTLEVVSKALPFYGQYFSIDYPLPKMDVIAISDVAFNAMENWGLVVHRDSKVLVDEKNTDAKRKEFIGIIVAHEQAHQWFGNLVTMEWWTHLWLNEGYASFMEYLCVDALFPEYEIWKRFVSIDYGQAMILDALHNSHPIEVPVANLAEINEIFDEISYKKGSSIIRMLHNWLGDDNFRKGMTLYLNRHKYQNAQTDDLWVALGDASSKPVQEVMTSWTKQKGFPVISVSQTTEGNKRILQVSQEKFAADGKVPEEEKKTLWSIPLNVTTASSADKIVSSSLLSAKSAEITLDGIREGDWININHDASGFFRVQYSQDMLEQLIPAITSKTLSAIDRLTLQDDLFALVLAGKQSTVSFLKLLENFKNEDEFAVWNSICSRLTRVNLILSFTDIQPLFHTWGIRLLTPLYEKLGLNPKEGESQGDILLRSLVLSKLADFNEKSFAGEARKLFDTHVAGTHLIPADTRSAVYCSVARNADVFVWQSFFKLFRETDQQEEKDRIAYALGCLPTEERMYKVMAFSLTDEVPLTTSIVILQSVAENKVGHEMAWRLFKERINIYKTRYEGGLLARLLVQYATKNFASREKADEIEKYFQSSPFGGGERAAQQSVESVRLNADWLERDVRDIKDYLTSVIS